MDGGTMFSMNISWAAPVVWPGAVYGLEIAIIGDRGIIDIEDTHRDLVLASEIAQGAGYAPDGFTPEFQRHVDFMTSYPPGDVYKGQLWGDRKSTRLNSSHYCASRMPSSAWKKKHTRHRQ